jgi:hypothetical protein
MRILVLLLAASVSVASGAARASANSSPSPQITLVEASSLPRPGGGQRIRYTIYQRLQPLMAGTHAGSVAAGGAVGLSYEQDPAGWVDVGTIVVESYGPQGAPAAKVAPVAASSPEESRASAPLTLAIAPVAANPARGRALVVDVALPSADPARLEVLDVMGRRVAMRELGSLGTGRHSVDLGAGQRFAPGVYLLRLTQGNDARVARVTVID